jgi:hypothetical protein
MTVQRYLDDDSVSFSHYDALGRRFALTVNNPFDGVFWEIYTGTANQRWFLEPIQRTHRRDDINMDGRVNAEDTTMRDSFTRPNNPVQPNALQFFLARLSGGNIEDDFPRPATPLPCLGGTISPPINTGLVGAHITNGNVLRGSNAALDINVLDLIDGTCIQANEIRGIQATIWAPQANTRQIFVSVNGVDSPMFNTDTTNPDRIPLPREAVHDLTWNFNTAQLNAIAANPNDFSIQIRSNNAAFGVAPISLLGADGEFLGIAEYSAQDSTGVWYDFSAGSCGCFTPNICLRGGTIASPINTGTVGAHVINGNALRNNTNAVLDFNVLELIAGTSIRANEIYGIGATIWAPQANTRQIYVDVNGVSSPMFETNTTRPERIHLPREAVHPLTYLVNSPFVSTVNPAAFNVRIRSSNAVWGVGLISLLGANGEVLGVIKYSTQDSNGTWGQFLECVCGNC